MNPAEILRLNEADKDEILDLRNRVISKLENPDWYVREDNEEEFVHLHLKEKGESYGAFVDGKLVGYSALGLPDTMNECMTSQVGTCFIAPNRTAHLSATMVLPEFRGHHLQRQFIQRRLDRALALGRTNVLAMVSPQNTASLGNLMDANFRIIEVAEMCQGLTRFIVHRNLQAVPQRAYSNPLLIPLHDLAEQIRTLALGLWGRYLLKHGSRAYVLYST